MSEQIKAEIMRLMREEFDPRPPNYGGYSWDDNAEAVADSIITTTRLTSLAEDNAKLRARVEEECAQLVENEMPATQDMESTMICDALERAAKAIRARSNLGGGDE